MTHLWSLDSCNCVLEMNIQEETFELIKWIQKCHIHKNELDQNLVAAILAHNNSFNAATELNHREIVTSKQVEKSRISNLGGNITNEN